MELYKYEETDDDVIFFITDLEEFLEDHNECMETDYQSIKEFNKGEPHRILTEINLN
tara:strand:- start:920 stop:1090 length:171 start_codon:yes stop_codon:yes gene_type:complete